MSDTKSNGNGSVATFEEAHGDDSHLQVILEQENYDQVMSVVERAADRKVGGGFEYWLRRCIQTGAQTIVRPWNDRDIVTLMAQAQRGDKKAMEKIFKLVPNLAKELGR